MRNDPQRPPTFAPCCALSLILMGVAFLPAGCRRDEAADAAISADSIPVQTPPASGNPVFTDIAEASGIDFVHFIGATGKMYFPEIMGSGGALFDYDNDGDLDLYAVQSCVLEPGKTTADAVFPYIGDEPPRNRLFRNDLAPAANGPAAVRFTDVTDAAGVGDTGYGMGCATGDFDGDGHVDLYVTNFGPNVLYRNNGDGTFSDVTARAGLQDPRWSTSAAFLDYDGDERLDLYVASYLRFTVRNHKVCTGWQGLDEYCGPVSYQDAADRLFRNNGDGTFTDVTLQTGLAQATGAGLGVVAADFDGDDRTDIYVANDDDPNQLYINQRRGTFRDQAQLAGTAFNQDGMPEAGMGLACADFDRDGDLDLFVTHLINETNTFYENLGDGRFEDSTFRLNIGYSSVPFTAFGTGGIDYDNDSLLDLFIGNGAVKAVNELRGEPFPYHHPNQMLRQARPGRFEDVSDQLGPAFQLSESTRGASFGDVDNDGDVDIVVFNGNGRLRLLRNDCENENHWVRFRVRQTGPNPDAIGALVELRPPDGALLLGRVATDGSYCSANDVRVHFGLGACNAIDTVVVRWPDGDVERFADIEVDRETLLIRGKGRSAAP